MQKKRCPNGTRKDKFGNCVPYAKKSTKKANSPANPIPPPMKEPSPIPSPIKPPSPIPSPIKPPSPIPSPRMKTPSPPMKVEKSNTCKKGTRKVCIPIDRIEPWMEEYLQQETPRMKSPTPPMKSPTPPMKSPTPPMKSPPRIKEPTPRIKTPPTPPQKEEHIPIEVSELPEVVITSSLPAKKIKKGKEVSMDPRVENDENTEIGNIENNSYRDSGISYIYLGTYTFDYMYKSSGDIPHIKKVNYHPTIVTFEAVKTNEYDDVLNQIEVNSTLPKKEGLKLKIPNKITVSIVERYLNHIKIKLGSKDVVSSFLNDSMEFNYGHKYGVRVYILQDNPSKYALYQCHIFEILPHKAPPANIYMLYNLRRVIKPNWNNIFINSLEISPITLVIGNDDQFYESNSWYLNNEPLHPNSPQPNQFFNSYPPKMESLIVSGVKKSKKSSEINIPKIESHECYNPLSMDIMPIDEWINENRDINIVLHIPEYNIQIATTKEIVLPRSSFDDYTYRYNVLYKCDKLHIMRQNIENKIINYSDSFISLKYIGIPGTYALNMEQVMQNINNSNQFVIISTDTTNNLIPEIELMNSLEAYPELYLKKYNKNEVKPGYYVPQGDDMSAALHGYTIRWDVLMNKYLRYDDAIKLPINKFTPDILYATQRRIRNLDMAFANAPRFQERTALYRAINLGSNMIISRNDINTGIFPAYISTTYSKEFAYDFLNKIRSFSNKQINCCVFTYLVDEGVPYLPIAFSEGAGDQMEVLLPRDLELSIISINNVNKSGFSEPVILVSLPKNHTYALHKNICSDYKIAEIHSI
jgi:ADP-ribosyltransferase exoenzyme